MNSTEFAERRVLPLVAAFAVGVLVTSVAAEHEARAEREAAHRLMQASLQLERCVRRVVDAMQQSRALPADYGCALATPPAEPLRTAGR